MILAPVALVVNINTVMGKLINKSTERHVIQVAVGIIINNLGQLLVAKRPDHWLGGGFWEFPGGKLEANEDSVSALKRELLEEVGITVEECSPLIRLTYDYPERTVILQAWNVHSFTGDAIGLEGQEICWRSPGSLHQLNMLPANRAIVVATLLPDTYFITPECKNDSDFLRALERKLQQDPIKMLQLRSQNLNRHDYIALAKKVSTLCQKSEVSLLLNHTDLTVFAEVDAAGLQLQRQQLEMVTERPIPKDKWLGTFCNNASDIHQAEKIGADFISIDRAPSLSEEFNKLISTANLPVFTSNPTSLEEYQVVSRYFWNGIN